MAKASHKITKVSNTWLQACVCLVAVPGLFTIIILLVQSTFNTQWKSYHERSLSSIEKIDGSIIIALLRTIQAILSTLSSFALGDCFQLLQWALASRKRGLTYASIVALSPTTGVLGMIKYIVLTSIVKTSTIIVFDTATTYNVTAGVGPFNGSYVQPFLDFLTSLSPPEYPYQILPYTYFAPVFNLVVSPMYSSPVAPVQCLGNDDCFSYLLSGGLELVTPWPPLNWSSYPLLEFTKLIGDAFSDADCQALGDPNGSIGVQLCIAEDEYDLGTLRAGIFSCTDGAKEGICHKSTPAPNITTTVKFFTRHADIIASRSNYSIMSTENLSAPVQLKHIDIEAYKLALGWLLNFTAVNIPAPSSIVSNFVIANEQLENPLTYGTLLQTFQSIIAFPHWLFNANNYGNIALQPQDVINTLPPDFYTSASIVSPYTMLKFDASMFYLFLALQGAVIVFTWIVLLGVWVGGKDGMPIISSFPLLDIALKCRLEVQADQSAVICADSSDLLRMIGSNRAGLKTGR
ncbi:hypothetical protein HD806DRAFT_552487 [Xylariaceae sp. AK1471]|nr:hypothetical protein HD806DRAFT_552487 [Xylariaceae sp. AK1471]